MTGWKSLLRPLTRRGRGLFHRYLGEVGYLSRHFHYAQAALRERDEIARRKRAAARNSERASPRAREVASALERQGYFLTSVTELGLTDEVVDYCKMLAEPALATSLEKVQAQRAGRGKSYWLDLYENVRDEKTPVTDLIAARDIIDICSLYFGQAPFVHECSLYFTPPGAAFLPAEMQGSQNWHLDNDRPRRIKLFLLPYGADAEAGATMFLPKPDSQLRKYRNFPGYFDDKQMRDYGLNPDKIVRFTGAPGAVMFFDTSRLFHCGSRTRSKPRVVLNIDLSPVTSYLPYNHLSNGPLRRPRFAVLNQDLLK
jgi:hypothetical protein